MDETHSWAYLKDLAALGFLDGGLFVWGSMFHSRLCWNSVLPLSVTTGTSKSKLVLFSPPNMVPQIKLGTAGICEIKRGMNNWNICWLIVNCENIGVCDRGGISQLLLWGSLEAPLSCEWGLEHNSSHPLMDIQNRHTELHPRGLYHLPLTDHRGDWRDCFMGKCLLWLVNGTWVESDHCNQGCFK